VFETTTSLHSPKHPKTNITPGRRKLIFQPQCFRCHVTFREGIYWSPNCMIQICKATLPETNIQLMLQKSLSQPQFGRINKHVNNGINYQSFGLFSGALAVSFRKCIYPTDQGVSEFQTTVHVKPHSFRIRWVWKNKNGTKNTYPLSTFQWWYKIDQFIPKYPYM